jgi:hypothetical protein
MIRFFRDRLIAVLKKQPGVTLKDVTYLTATKIGNKDLKVEELPFLKRHPYKDEREFRAIYESKNKLESLDITISLNCIDRIILSPWMPEGLEKHVKATLQGIDGCKNLDIRRYSSISNKRWKNYGESAL